MILIILTAAILSIIIILIIFYRFYFLRKPIRNPPKGENIISPANGKIIKIIEFRNNKLNTTINKGLLGKIKTQTKDVAKSGYIICIMMTIFNVHYQRSPIEGTIVSTKHTKGKFYNANVGVQNLKFFHNEKNEIIIKNKDTKVKVIQIAGALARRIRSYVKPNQKLNKGDTLGLIRLGSMVVLITPKIKLRIKNGQKVIDGQTIIAKY